MRSLQAWLYAPQRIERLELLRGFAPLAVLAFMATRIVHADYWIGDAGFNVPDIGGDWRQPLYLPPLPSTLAWALVGVMVVAGLATSAGLYTGTSACVFAFTLVYVALADRLAAFTVSKLSPVIMLTIAASAAGTRWSLDAWRRKHRRGALPGYASPNYASGGSVRFIQILLPVFYCTSGLCKARGDWLERSDVLWTHLHSSYQTALSHALANGLPAWSWSVMQHTTLVFEVLSPLWFGLAATRKGAFIYGVAMHVMIGVMFGPVRWFSLLMITLLLCAYLPERWLLVTPLSRDHDHDRVP